MKSIEYNGIERPEHTPDMISELKADEVFVFGSNLEGMHGGGAAFKIWSCLGLRCGPSWPELRHSDDARWSRGHQAIRG